MTRAPRNPRLKDYQVGYGKPPCHTRFRPGVSGNPGGRPRGASAGRADRLALKEIYRLIAVREGEQTQTLTTLQAVVRQLGRVALKGNGPTLRAYLGIAQAIEHRVATQTGSPSNVQIHNITDEQRARALAAFLRRTNLHANGTFETQIVRDDGTVRTPTESSIK